MSGRFRGDYHLHPNSAYNNAPYLVVQLILHTVSLYNLLRISRTFRNAIVFYQRNVTLLKISLYLSYLYIFHHIVKLLAKNRFVFKIRHPVFLTEQVDYDCAFTIRNLSIVQCCLLTLSIYAILPEILCISLLSIIHKINDNFI